MSLFDGAAHRCRDTHVNRTWIHAPNEAAYPRLRATECSERYSHDSTGTISFNDLNH